MKLLDIENLARSRATLWTAAAAVAGVVTAAWVHRRASRAEREHLPTGRVLEVDGVRLHVVERGQGPPVVLIHGNLVSHSDFEVSGLIDRLAAKHRVIAIDRPGFGNSSRPRDRLWTPTEQAALLFKALALLDAERAVVVGHSMGAMLALALALEHPQAVSRLVLISGYFYPSARIDAVLTAPLALPVIGDVLRYTVTALSARLMLKGAVKGMFTPRKVPDAFVSTMSREMLLRPVQLRANAEDAAFMIGQAKASSKRHAELKIPVAIFAGAKDLVVDHEAHSVRLHRSLPGSTLAVIPGVGHMVHHAVMEDIVAAIETTETAYKARALRAP